MTIFLGLQSIKNARFWHYSFESNLYRKTAKQPTKPTTAFQMSGFALYLYLTFAFVERVKL